MPKIKYVHVNELNDDSNTWSWNKAQQCTVKFIFIKS